MYRDGRIFYFIFYFLKCKTIIHGKCVFHYQSLSMSNIASQIPRMRIVIQKSLLFLPTAVNIITILFTFNGCRGLRLTSKCQLLNKRKGAAVVYGLHRQLGAVFKVIGDPSNNQ